MNISLPNILLGIILCPVIIVVCTLASVFVLAGAHGVRSFIILFLAARKKRK
jgi:hypothetical protein